jgi:hypothetical protein
VNAWLANPWLHLGLAAVGGTCIVVGVVIAAYRWVIDAETAELERKNAALQTDRNRP